MICPAPDMYFPNTDVLAFLNVDEKGNYYTHALSYGAKTLAAQAIDIYKARIIEVQGILKEQDKFKQFMTTVAWLVRCAENTYTRWEGTYELSPSSDFMSYYQRSQPEQFELLLTRDDRERLRVSLLQQQQLEYDDLGLVDLVYEGKKDQVYQLLLTNLKSLDEDHLWFAGDLMKRLTYFNSGPEFDALLKQCEASLYEMDENKGPDTKKVIEQFIALVER
jgi:hypothetical protein